MKKYIFFLMGAVCFLLSSSAVHANELNKSDANIIGHVLDKNTEEHLQTMWAKQSSSLDYLKFNLGNI